VRGSFPFRRCIWRTPRQVDAEHVFAGLIIQQSSRHGFARAPGVIKQGPIAGFNFLVPAPRMKQRIVVSDPVLDFPDLAERTGVQQEVVLFHWGLNVLGRKVHAEARRAHSSGGQKLGERRNEDEPTV
jgi:hypothetical protein